MVEEFSLFWRLRHWLALRIGGVHIAHQEKMLKEAIEGWRKTNRALERQVADAEYAAWNNADACKKLEALLADAPDHSDLDAAAFEINNLTSKNTTLEQQVTTLQKKANFLEALRIAGVDNWQGYSQAYEAAREYGLDIGDD